MRVMPNRLSRDERGAIAVIFAIMLVVLIGLVALTIDGGLLYTKHRGMRNVNDSASLAAALSCARGEGQVAADGQADLIAGMNVDDATQIDPNQYTPACDAPAGKVTVHYGGQQALMFAPAIGITSPKPVSAQATATWGATGETNRVAPLMLSARRMGSCNIPEDAQEGDHCFFWWDNGTGQTGDTALTNAEWGGLDLRTWGITTVESCSGAQVTPPLFEQWINEGYPDWLGLETMPTYVCRGQGFESAINQDINDLPDGTMLRFPVNDPQQQMGTTGGGQLVVCPPGANCTVDRYAIVGFGMLEVVQVWTGRSAVDMCQPPVAPSGFGSIRCLEAIWRGYQSEGLMNGNGENFGVVSVSLSE